MPRRGRAPPARGPDLEGAPFLLTYRPVGTDLIRRAGTCQRGPPARRSGAGAGYGPAGCGTGQGFVAPAACNQPYTSSQMMVAAQRQRRSESIRGVTSSTTIRDVFVARTGQALLATSLWVRRVFSGPMRQECVVAGSKRGKESTQLVGRDAVECRA